MRLYLALVAGVTFGLGGAYLASLLGRKLREGCCGETFCLAEAHHACERCGAEYCYRHILMVGPYGAETTLCKFCRRGLFLNVRGKLIGGL